VWFKRLVREWGEEVLRTGKVPRSERGRHVKVCSSVYDEDFKKAFQEELRKQTASGAGIDMGLIKKVCKDVGARMCGCMCVCVCVGMHVLCVCVNFVACTLSSMCVSVCWSLCLYVRASSK
jgi:hypothetical protein